MSFQGSSPPEVIYDDKLFLARIRSERTWTENFHGPIGLATVEKKHQGKCLPLGHTYGLILESVNHTKCSA